MTYPKLDGIVKEADVQKKGTGAYTASYVNWSRIAKYLREHAPGWQPFAATAPDGGIVWPAPDGTGFLMIGFVCNYNLDGDLLAEEYRWKTELVPHAIMDHKLHAKKNPDARDVADAFVRGMCKAAALLFGLGWQLWSKDDPFDRNDDAPAASKPETNGGGVRGFDSPDTATLKLKAATTIDALAKVWMHVNASGFLPDELDGLAKIKDERKAQLMETTNG